MVAVHKNILPAQHFEVIRDLFMSERLSCLYNDRVATTERQFMFNHTFLNDGKVINRQFFGPVEAMLALIQQKRRFIGVSRIKANLYTNQGKTIEHPAHFDIPPDAGDADKFCIGVFHVNECNGVTVVGDQEFKSRENQLILFDNVSHYGTVQTDTDTRVVINFNLRTRE